MHSFGRDSCTCINTNLTKNSTKLIVMYTKQNFCVLVKVDEEEGEYSQGVKDEEQHEEQLNNVSKRLVDLIRRFPALYQ